MKEREGLFREIAHLQELGDREFYIQPLVGTLPLGAAHLGYHLKNGIPFLVARENQPWGTTFYVEIDLNIPQDYCENSVKGKCVKSGKTAKPVSPTSAIFVPRGFEPGKPASLIIYLHGHKTNKPGTEASIQVYLNYTADTTLRLREKVQEAGRNVIFVAPTLGPKSAAGSLVKKGGFDAYVAAIIKAIEYHAFGGGYKKSYAPCGLVLAAHSGGGKPMAAIVTLPDQYAGQIRECWGFDSLYQGHALWNKWSDGKSGRIYYNYYGDDNNNHKVASPVAQSAKLSVFNKRHSTDLRPKRISHWSVLTKFLAERIKGLPACDPEREFETGWIWGGLPTPAPQPAPGSPGLFFRPTSPSLFYGQFDLLLDDKDGNGKQLYGGAAQGIAGNQAHVKQLQQDLLELGFGYKSKPDGVFDFDTECAVREFQIYAKMPNVAVEQTGKGMLLNPVDRYAATPNNYPYPGEINGVVNQETRNRIEFWKTNNWRCPVIIQAWEYEVISQARTKVYKHNYNIWKHDAVRVSELRKGVSYVRMFVRDFTGYYKTAPCVVPGGRNLDDYFMIGSYIPWNDRHKGPGSTEGSQKNRGTWPETKIAPHDWLGKRFDQLETAEKSTFKVIRAVAEVECEGHMDRINGYDNAFISLGPYHFVLGINSYSDGKGATDGGELPSYLAFLKEHTTAKATYEKAFGFFGMAINKAWLANGQPFFMSGSQRKYGLGRVAFKRGAKPVVMPSGYNEGFEFGNYFRNWHWFYRFIMAARVFPEFRSRMWDFSRLRIRDLFSIAVADEHMEKGKPVPLTKKLNFTDGQGQRITPALSEIFTSELAVALVLRIHVWRPAWMANVNSNGNTLRGILVKALAVMKKAGIASTDLSQWGDQQQTILVDTIFNTLTDDGLKRSLRRVRDFSLQQGGVLSAAAGSFQFHSAGLPAPPNY